MQTEVVNAGDIVVSDFGHYQHWSIVSDAICAKGLPRLISATKRNGTVRVEDWDTVTNGCSKYRAKINYDRPVYEVLEMARSQIDSWKYSITEKNCEHFAKWATGLHVSSTQVKAGVTGAILGAGIVGLAAENPKMAKLLGGAVLLGGLAVWASKAPRSE